MRSLIESTDWPEREPILQKGDLVVFKGHDDTQRRWGNNAETVGVLEPNAVYEVKDVEVHSWHTKVYLTVAPNSGFNSVMFNKERA